MVKTQSVRKLKALNEVNGVRAIVLDDQAKDVEKTVQLLKAEGYEVLGFTDPREALLQIEHFKPHVFVTDTEMPKMHGLRVLEAVKDSYPDLPVIFLSYDLNKEVLLKAIELGVFGVLESASAEADLLEFCFSAVAGELYPNAKVLRVGRKKFVNLADTSLN